MLGVKALDGLLEAYLAKDVYIVGAEDRLLPALIDCAIFLEHILEVSQEIPVDEELDDDWDWSKRLARGRRALDAL